MNPTAVRVSVLRWRSARLRRGLAAWGLATAAALSACGNAEDAAPAPGAAPPAVREPRYDHVVLVTLDTLRADHLQSYGYARDTAPFLARLAEEGVLFENALSTVSHTAPSHATMLTGVPPRMHGVRKNGNKLKEPERTLPALVRERGFTSGAFISAGFLSGISQAFDHLQRPARTSAELVDQAIAWARSRADERFVLWLHLFDPHRWKRARLSDEARRAVVDGQRLEEGALALYDYVTRLHGLPPLAPGAPFELPWRGGDGRGFAHGPGSREDVVRYVDDYDALIRVADAEVARLYAALEPPGSTRKGLWILTSDHGEGLGSHGYEGHGGSIYNEQLRVGLVFHATDGSLRPRRVGELVGHVDLLPTLAELLGFDWSPPHDEYLGRSLVPLLDDTLGGGAATSFPERLFFAEQRRTNDDDSGDAGELVAIQDRRHKLIVHADGTEELFALDRDPLELHDVGEDDPRRAELRSALEQRLAFFSQLAAGEVEEADPEFLDELKDLGYAR